MSADGGASSARVDGEMIANVRVGESVAHGYEIARILATGYEQWAPGTNAVVVFTVALRPTPASAQSADAPLPDGEAT